MTKVTRSNQLNGMFVNDSFNWSNSKYRLYYKKGGLKHDEKDLVWTLEQNKNPYTVNSLGYRSDEFSETRDIVFAGCSHTWGVGVVVDGIWGNILSESLNTKSYNLGISGKGVQFIVKNTIAFCKEYGNPKAIFCLFPEFTRIQMKSDASFMVGKNTPPGKVGRHEYNVIPNRINPIKDTKYSKAPHLAEDMIPSEFLFSVNLDYIHMLELYCELNNIKLFWGTWDGWQDKYLQTNIDSTDFKNYVYLEQEKWDREPDNMYMDQIFENGIAIDCHKEYKEKYGLNFGFPMDGNPRNGLPGEKFTLGHPAVHRHIHIAERFLEALKNDSN